MMSSLTTSSVARIDHRTVYKKNLQPKANKSTKSSTTADVLNPINNKTTVTCYTKSNSYSHFPTPSYLFITTPRTYIQQRSESGSLAPKTKIPYPLATLRSKQKLNHFKRSSSLRMCGKKSNLPLIMEPTINETATANSTAVNRNKSKEITIENVAAVGLKVSAKRKLAVISKTDANVTELPLINRSQSLRRNFKVSLFSDNKSLDDKTDLPNNKICAAKHMKSISLFDVSKIKDQGDVFKTTATETASSISAAPKSTATEIVKDISNMSLLDNDDTKLNETIARITTPTTPKTPTTTTNISPATATVTQQTRPLTLNTSTTASISLTSKVVKTSPKTPHRVAGDPTTPNSTIQTPVNTSSQSKLSPGSKLTPKTPPVTPDSPSTYLYDDLDSLFSYGTTTSGRSTMSCEHPYVARNGTTFSGRQMKYVVHCSNYAGQVGSDYLTPTQRAQRQLRRLKELLCSARTDLEQKDSEILRLTREVVELRLFKASLCSPEERSASSDAVTVREAELKTSQDVSPIIDMVDDAQKTTSPRHHAHTPSAMLHHQQNNMLHLSSDMQSSYADSGHYEDMTTSSVHSKDSSSYTTSLHLHDQACGSERATRLPNAMAESGASVEQYELQRQELIRLYEQRIEDLIRNQDAATSEMKRTNCDRIEALLQKLTECNTRYADIVPDYEHAKERIRELEKQLEELQRRLAEHEEKQKQMYLHMYQKGQEAERIARADQALELAHRAPQNKVSINELLHQLQSTQDELENIRAAECRNECGNNHALLTAKEAISLWVLGARKTIYRRLLEAKKNRTHVDPEVTLQFLKSAVYYFLTDKENSQGHLQAIEGILEFTEAEKQTINKARSAK